LPEARVAEHRDQTVDVVRQRLRAARHARIVALAANAPQASGFLRIGPAPECPVGHIKEAAIRRLAHVERPEVAHVAGAQEVLVLRDAKGRAVLLELEAAQYSFPPLAEEHAAGIR